MDDLVYATLSAAVTRIFQLESRAERANSAFFYAGILFTDKQPDLTVTVSFERMDNLR